jgi:molybdopterin-guanine dinucleotide biosynthesis protein A
VIKRLLLCGITLQRGDVAPGHPQLTGAIEADLTYALATLTDQAAVAASQAAHGLIWQRFNQFAGSRHQLEHIGERFHLDDRDYTRKQAAAGVYNVSMISIAVQAGGRSTRMGQDKALIPVAGKRLIEHVLDHVEGISDDLFITSNQPEKLRDLNYRLVSDRNPGRGALYGLETALQAARHDDVLVVACDMPFIQLKLLDHMLLLTGEADVIIPELENGYEPLLAIYRRSTCLPALRRSLHDQNPRMISFYPAVDVLAIPATIIDRLDPGRLSFFNINTPEDVQTAERRLQSLRST